MCGTSNHRTDIDTASKAEEVYRWRSLQAIQPVRNHSAVWKAETVYETIQTNADYDLRHYAPYRVAEITASRAFDQIGNEAFRIPAGIYLAITRTRRRSP